MMYLFGLLDIKSSLTHLDIIEGNLFISESTCTEAHFKLLSYTYLEFRFL